MSRAASKAKPNTVPRFELRRRLTEGATRLHIQLADEQLDALLTYMDVLVRWNQVYNLTGVQEPAEILTRHLFDSLAVLSYLHGE